MEQILLYMGVMLLFAKLLGSLFERFLTGGVGRRRKRLGARRVPDG